MTYICAMGEIIFNNWSLILLGLLAFGDILVSLTPSKTDDKILGYVRVLINAITGKRKNKK